MTYGPLLPPPPEEPTPRAPSPDNAAEAATTSPPGQPASTGPTSGEPTPAAPRPAIPPAGTGFGVVALVLGGLGCLLPLLPFPLGDAQSWISLPFALPGLVIGIVGTNGHRRGNVWAIVGSIVCTVAVGLSAVMLIGFRHDPKATTGPGHTEEILRDELDVRVGERYVDPETGAVAVVVTLYNKGQDTADYGVTLEVHDSGTLCEKPVAVSGLAPGASFQGFVDGCPKQHSHSPTNMEVRVTEAHKS